MTDYLKKRMQHILDDRPLAQKKKYTIPRKSEKRMQKEKEHAKAGSANELDKFFESMRKRMTGTCGCGCAGKTQKNDDTFYRGSIAHIFPKRIFKSIATHPLNWVERCMFSGCHSIFDDSSMDKWPGMADWDDIKEKFHQLAPLLTEKERASKFYSKLESLVYGR